MKINFIFLCEGSSDSPLADHISKMIVDRGAHEAVAIPIYDKGDLVDRLKRNLNSNPDIDLILIHRDSDNAGRAQRINEINSALRLANISLPTVPVIPVTMTESWLLVNERAIRKAARKPRGKNKLGIPKINNLESVRDPKARLKQALMEASGLSGRKKNDFAKQFFNCRRVIFQELDINGDVNQLKSWRFFVDDLYAAVDKLLSNSP